MTANDPAFPNTGNSTWDLRPAAGLTKREYAAIAILAAGMCDAEGLGEIPEHVRADIFKQAAAIAYEAADALLSASGEAEQ